MESFASRFEHARRRFGPLCWGLDPSGRILEDWGLGDTVAGLERFADIVIEAASESIGVVKPQSAFYERHGWEGIRTLARLCREARSEGILVIVDAKRGDVGSTNDAYAESYLGEDAPIRADALTVHPYLGLAAMGSFVERANKSGSCLLVVTRSSNPEGRAVQASVDGDGRPVEAALLDQISRINAELAPGSIGPVGAVIGPLSGETELDLVSPHALYLAPGVGAQGATPQDVARTFGACPDRVIPSASRSLLSGGPDIGALRDGLRELGAEFKQLL